VRLILNALSIEVGSRIGPYEVLGPLGRGGMGEVYKCRDLRLNRDCAIKVLPAGVVHDDASLAGLQREAQTLASLHHRNVATLFGVEDHHGTLALVMEFVPGTTLAERLRGGPLPIEEALVVLVQVAEGLEAAHARGIIHRDLKPGNVMWAEDGTAKVLDFGLATATALTNQETLTAVTAIPVTSGTPAYMSPEQVKGTALDERSDIWAFGCVLFEALTARRPFHRPTVAETLSAVLTAPVDWTLLPADLPSPIRRLLRRCLQRAATDRLRHIGDARLELEEVLEELRSGETTRPLTARAPARRPWQPAILVAAAIAVAALAFVIGGWSSRRGDTPASPMRMTVVPSPRLDFGEFAADPYPAVSSDGLHIAFAANTADAREQLVVQSIDQFQPRRLQGTAGVQWPFWSPDGRYIGYFAEGELRVIAENGGPARTIAKVPGAFGGTWNGAGTIVIGSNAGLLQVPAAGGTPAPALGTSPGAATTRRFPVFLPDGEHFLYTQVAAEGVSPGIYVATLGGGNPKLLVDAVINAAYVEPGYLLYVRDNTLMAHRFDASTQTLSGDPIAVDSPIAGSGTVRYAPVSAAAGTVVYRPSNQAISQLVVMDRDGRPVQSVGPEGTYLSPSIAPDGDRLAVTRMDTATGDFTVMEMSVSRNAGGRLNSGRTIEFQPVWSPDGQRLLYSAARRGTFALMERNFETGQDRELLNLPGRTFASGWLPNATGFLYTEEPGAGPEGNVWEYTFDGAKRRALVSSDADETHGRVSPDGRWLAYSSNDSGRWNVYLVPRSGGGRQLVSTAGGSNPQWRSDGKELYYAEYDERTRGSLAIDAVIKAVPITGDRPAEPVTLFRARVPVYSLYEVWVFSAFADGQRFVVNRVTNESQSGLQITRHWQPPAQ
jgi:Tol biopolymer transport system component